jgi:DNA (cytosine-5)-methyltransferase 1
MLDSLEIEGLRPSQLAGLCDDELVVDLFAGGGGASQGIFDALGRHPDIAINHDEDAIAVHTRNHPTTKHYCQSIWKVHPLEAVGARKVGLLHASPDCRHFSRAAGGRPKWKSVRSLPGVVLTWAKYARPRVITVENVKEMTSWGPLLDDGTPCPKRIGRSFRSWVNRLRNLGYQVEWREVCAADFGVPTIRTRLFIVARCDGLPIRWPQPTHSKRPTMFEQRWRSAAECIDWSIPCPSIFERKRPLKEATLRRIAEGVMRYVVNAKEPYVVDRRATHISQFYGTSGGAGMDQPLGAVTAQGEHHAVVAAHLAPLTHQGTHRGSAMQEPVPTLTCANRGEQALISAILSGCGGRAAQSPPKPVTEPFNTTTTKADQMLACAFMAQHNGGNDGHDIRDPLSTILSGGHHQQIVAAQLSPGEVERAARVTAFLIQYYSNGGQWQSLASPLGAATTKARFGLVTVAGMPIVDIGMRMLAKHELQAAQGFSPEYDMTDGGRLSKTASIRLIGNSVCPGAAAAVVRANLKPAPIPMMEAA